jgi:hypothetical protein
MQVQFPEFSEEQHEWFQRERKFWLKHGSTSLGIFFRDIELWFCNSCDYFVHRTSSELLKLYNVMAIHKKHILHAGSDFYKRHMILIRCLFLFQVLHLSNCFFQFPKYPSVYQTYIPSIDST